MWSGPRTVSTAMMRAWENRPDTVVIDEPLYAFYLSSTGIDHPGRDEVIASQPTSWQAVLSSLAEDPLPPGVTHRLRQAHDAPRAAVGRPGGVRAVPARVPDQGPALAARLLRAGSAPRRPWPTWACGSRRGCLRSSAARSSTRPTCSPRPRRGCGRCARRSACRSPRRCCPGRPGRARRTACGRRTGTTACGGRPGSPPATPGPPPPLDPALEPLLAECLPYYERLSKNKIKIDIPNDRALGS